MQTAEILQKILEAVARGGSAAEYLGNAYISFYRGGKTTVDLKESRVLDSGNLQLLFEMLTLRRRAGWSDDELHRVEQAIKKQLKAIA